MKIEKENNEICGLGSTSRVNLENPSDKTLENQHETESHR